MVTISRTTLSRVMIFLICWASIKITLKFVSQGAINNSLALADVMAWRRIGDKLLHQPMTNPSTDAYMRHQASMS